MLWVGQFDDVSWSWQDAGQLYGFPRSDNGTIRYGNIEGVGWITRTRVVTVSDCRKKKNQLDERLSEKDQSVHVFDMPRRTGMRSVAEDASSCHGSSQDWPKRPD
jgi:hypothetical protein